MIPKLRINGSGPNELPVTIPGDMPATRRHRAGTIAWVSVSFWKLSHFPTLVTLLLLACPHTEIRDNIKPGGRKEAWEQA